MEKTTKRASGVIPHSRPDIIPADIAAVVSALKNRRLAQGREVGALEEELASLFGDVEAIVVSSGTAALYLALSALGIRRGNKVIIPSYTCNSLFSAVSFTGATAVCADTEPGALNIGRRTVQSVMDKSVKAIIVPHTCGYLADVPAISGLGRPIIEDCAQAAGGHYLDGSRVGSKGDVGVFSFYATKLIPAGEGGACLTADREMAASIRRLRDCDKRAPDGRAFNFKMTDISAALARRKLKELPKTVKKRATMAGLYDKIFGKSSMRFQSPEHQAVCLRYIVETDREIDAVLTEALARGITCMRPIWRPLHYSIGGNCPHTETLDKTLVSVPLYPALTGGEMQEILAKVPGLLNRVRTGT